MRKLQKISIVFSYTFLLLLFGFSSPVGHAAKKDEPPILIKAEVDRAVITIGDMVRYQVTIKHKSTVSILSAIPTPPNDILRIKNIRDIQAKDGDYAVTGKSFDLTTFRLGKYVLDPVLIEYREGGGDVQKISTEPLYIRVKSISEGETMEDIRGNKTVLSLARKILKWLIIITLSGLILVTLIFLWRQARKRAAGLVMAPNKLTAEEEAAMKLHKLFDSDLIRRDQHKQYYLILSEILRTYFEQRFEILAVESTTHEIMTSLRGVHIESSLKEKIKEVLEVADLAKFAKWKPEPTLVMDINKKSLQIIEQAKPVSEPEVPEASENGI